MLAEPIETKINTLQGGLEFQRDTLKFSKGDLHCLHVLDIRLLMFSVSTSSKFFGKSKADRVVYLLIYLKFFESI